MDFPKRRHEENKRYTWAYLLKYTFYSSLLSTTLLLLYGICLVLIYNNDFSVSSGMFVLKENFHYAQYNNKIFPAIIFYIFFEEFVFRKSLQISINNILLTLPLLFFLGCKSFLDQSAHLYTYGIYSLFIIIFYNRRVNSKWVQKINFVLSLITLSTFHVSKFELEYTSGREILFYHIIPIIIIGIVLAHLRLKFNSFSSLIAYFLIISFTNFIHY